MKNERLQAALYEVLDIDKTIVFRDINLKSKGIEDNVNVIVNINYYNPLLIDENDLNNYTYPLTINIFDKRDPNCLDPIATFENSGIHRMLTHELRGVKLYELVIDFFKEDNDIDAITNSADILFLNMLEFSEDTEG